jgi:hypothetical protein
MNDTSHYQLTHKVIFIISRLTRMTVTEVIETNIDEEYYLDEEGAEPSNDDTAIEKEGTMC